jgi:cytochrome b561
MNQAQPRVTTHAILVIVLTYAALASVWILLSDQAMAWLFSDPEAILLTSTLKGWLFVLVTSLLLFGVLRRLVNAAPELPTKTPRAARYSLVFGVSVALVFALATVGILYSYDQHRDKEVARLQAIADLKTRQIADWLNERSKDAEYLRHDPYFAENYRQWRDLGMAPARERLQQRLMDYVRGHEFSAATLLDPAGHPLFRTELAPLLLTPEVVDAAAKVAREGEIQSVGLCRGIRGHARMDYVLPIAKTTPLASHHPA